MLAFSSFPETQPAVASDLPVRDSMIQGNVPSGSASVKLVTSGLALKPGSATVLPNHQRWPRWSHLFTIA
jgi:hypothetical protein